MLTAKTDVKSDPQMLSTTSGISVRACDWG